MHATGLARKPGACLREGGLWIFYPDEVLKNERTAEHNTVKGGTQILSDDKSQSDCNRNN
jgi:hypothetical protein